MNNGDNNFYTNDNFYTNAEDPNVNEQDPAKKIEVDKLGSRCMVFGIISVALVFTCPCLPTFILAIISLYYYAKAKKLLNTPKLSGNLIAGMVCSIVSLSTTIFHILYILFFLFYILFILFIGSLTL